eukprot:3916676-Pyramimonas_sp.AAC.1
MTQSTELRMRARGQHATTIETRTGILCHILHVMEAELNRLDIPLVLTRLQRGVSMQRPVRTATRNAR